MKGETKQIGNLGGRKRKHCLFQSTLLPYTDAVREDCNFGGKPGGLRSHCCSRVAGTQSRATVTASRHPQLRYLCCWLSPPSASSSLPAAGNTCRAQEGFIHFSQGGDRIPGKVGFRKMFASIPQSSWMKGVKAGSWIPSQRHPNPSELEDRVVLPASGKLRLKPWREGAVCTESRQARYGMQNWDKKPRIQGQGPRRNFTSRGR